MSGNSTQFALRAAQLAWSDAWPAGAMVGLFVIGVMIGRFLAILAKARGRQAILTFETVCLGLAAAVPLASVPQAALMALAMGAQNGIVHRAGETKTSLTYVTGTLVNFGERLADALAGRGPASACLPYLSLWAALVAGGGAGAVAFGRWGIAALALPAIATALLAMATAAPARRS